MILFTCAATIIINTSSLAWVEKDMDPFHRAIKTCERKYDDCLQTFIKKDAIIKKNGVHYYAICAGKRESKYAKLKRLGKERLELIEKITNIRDKK